MNLFARVEDPVAGAEHVPVRLDLPGQAEARCEVVPVDILRVLVTVARRVQLTGRRIEVDVHVLAVAVHRRRVLVAQAQVRRDVRRDLEVILEEPGIRLLPVVDDRLGHRHVGLGRTEHEVGQRVAGEGAVERIRRCDAFDRPVRRPSSGGLQRPSSASDGRRARTRCRGTGWRAASGTADGSCGYRPASNSRC